MGEAPRGPNPHGGWGALGTHSTPPSPPLALEQAWAQAKDWHSTSGLHDSPQFHL